MYYLISDPTRQTVAQLLKKDCPAQVDTTCFAPFRYVNLQAMYTVLDLITWVSFACQTMGFSIPCNSDDTCQDFNTDKPQREDYKDISTTILEDRSELLDIPEGYHPLVRILRGTIPHTFLDQYPAGKVASQYLWSNPSYTSSRTFTTDENGLIVRYVPELADADSTTVPSFIRENFLGNIGNSEGDCVRTFHQVKSAWGVIKSSDFGLMLSHLCKCFLIALDAGAAMKPLFDSGFYEGSVIFGPTFKLALHGKIVLPLSNEDLLLEISGLSTHFNALQEIQRVIAGVYKEGKSIMEVTNMVELRSTLLNLHLNENLRQIIVKSAEDLRFPLRPWSINLGSLKLALNLIMDPQSLKNDFPISPRALFSKDMIVVALSCFGEESCPSFHNPNGTPISLTGSLPDPSSKERQRGKDKKGKQQTSSGGWTFTVSRVKFDRAVGDLRTVLREKVARSISSNVARATGCVTFRDKPFAELFGLLQDLSKRLDGSAEVQVPSEGKRALEGVDAFIDTTPSEHRTKKVKL